MTRLTILVSALFIPACVADSTDTGPQPGEQALPPAGGAGGKGDGSTDGAMAYVAFTSSAGTADSRDTPYHPRSSLDNVLIYGCEAWNFSDGAKGLEIQYEELVHASFTVDPNDPKVAKRQLDVYIGGFSGAGSYDQQQGVFSASTDSAELVDAHGCAVTVTPADGNGFAGTFSCALGGESITGQFSCPGTSTESFQFVDWPGSPATN